MNGSSQSYVGLSTPFGKIIAVEPSLYSAQATVQHRDGSTSTYRLSSLQAHGVQGARG